VPSALPGAGRGRPSSAVDAWVRSAGTLSAGAGVGASRGCGARHSKARTPNPKTPNPNPLKPLNPKP